MKKYADLQAMQKRVLSSIYDLTVARDDPFVWYGVGAISDQLDILCSCRAGLSPDLRASFIPSYQDLAALAEFYMDKKYVLQITIERKMASVNRGHAIVDAKGYKANLALNDAIVSEIGNRVVLFPQIKI